MDYQGASAPQKKKRAYAAQAYDFGANAAGAGPAAPLPMGSPVVDPLAGQFGQMNLGPGQPQQPMMQQPMQPMQPMQPIQQMPQQMAPQQTQLNQLVTTDLMSAPFNVYELDQLPPPIILPPNVSRRPRWARRAPC